MAMGIYLILSIRLSKLDLVQFLKGIVDELLRKISLFLLKVLMMRLSCQLISLGMPSPPDKKENK